MNQSSSSTTHPQPHSPSHPPSHPSSTSSHLFPRSRHSAKRQGDWICLYCSNYNYSFRLQCNRCQMNPISISSQIDSSSPILTIQDNKIGRRESVWKIDENTIDWDPMRRNCFKRMLFLTPPKGDKREGRSERKRKGERQVMGVIQNNTKDGKKKEREGKGKDKENLEKEMLRWVAQLVDE